MVFPRQEYWNELSLPSPGDLHNSGTEPTSSVLAGEFFTTEPARMSPFPSYPTAKSLPSAKSENSNSNRNQIWSRLSTLSPTLPTQRHLLSMKSEDLVGFYKIPYYLMPGFLFSYIFNHILFLSFTHTRLLRVPGKCQASFYFMPFALTVLWETCSSIKTHRYLPHLTSLYLLRKAFLKPPQTFFNAFTCLILYVIYQYLFINSHSYF